MPQIGATIEQMDQLSSTFSRESEDVARLTAAISGQVGSTWWVGPAADRFKAAWDGQYRPMLTQLQSDLQECQAEVQRRSAAISAAGS